MFASQVASQGVEQAPSSLVDREVKRPIGVSDPAAATVAAEQLQQEGRKLKLIYSINCCSNNESYSMDDPFIIKKDTVVTCELPSVDREKDEICNVYFWNERGSHYVQVSVEALERCSQNVD
jgi:hypothetical protein